MDGMMAVVGSGILFLIGAFLVIITLLSAIRTVVLPRDEPVLITRVIFTLLYSLFRARAAKMQSYHEADRVMALYAPLTLVMLPGVWIVLVMTGYTLMFWVAGIRPWLEAFRTSGSALLTLGFASVNSVPQILLTFSEATIGLGLVGLMISYLPTIYSNFSRREAAVTMLEVRAGAPPSSMELIERVNRISELGGLGPLWVQWEVWFTEVEESHTSLPILCFFRSPDANRSWLTAAGTIMDAAALIQSCLNVPNDPQRALCIRAGYICLRRIADQFDIKYDRDPTLADPISITRTDFDGVWEHMQAAGLAMKPDREQAWRDYRGWRVNYDSVLIGLATLIMAPAAPWVSDRSVMNRRPKINPVTLLGRRGV